MDEQYMKMQISRHPDGEVDATIEFLVVKFLPFRIDVLLLLFLLHLPALANA